MTNYEKIKNMNVYELANAISHGVSSNACDYCPYNHNSCSDKCIRLSKIDIIVKWLNSEVEE